MRALTERLYRLHLAGECCYQCTKQDYRDHRCSGRMRVERNRQLEYRPCQCPVCHPQSQALEAGPEARPNLLTGAPEFLTHSISQLRDRPTAPALVGATSMVSAEMTERAGLLALGETPVAAISALLHPAACPPEGRLEA